MKLSAKLFAAALALPLLLAACGSASTPEGTVKFNDLKTEYRDGNGKFVACDNVIAEDGITTTKRTTVGVYYSASGTINSIGVDLQGSKSSSPDANFSGTFSGNQLQPISDGNYKTLFYADSAIAPLPLAITVNPNPNVAVKTVTATNNLGSFYAKLTINTASGSATTSSQSIGLTVPVYKDCKVTSTSTTDKL